MPQKALVLETTNFSKNGLAKAFKKAFINANNIIKIFSVLVVLK